MSHSFKNNDTTQHFIIDFVADYLLFILVCRTKLCNFTNTDVKPLLKNINAIIFDRGSYVTTFKCFVYLLCVTNLVEVFYYF